MRGSKGKKSGSTKFLLDANLPYSLKAVFGNEFSVFHVRDVGLFSAKDSEILAWAKKNNAVIVSKDLDFANILAVPPSTHCGVVILRVPDFYTAEAIKRVLSDFLKNNPGMDFRRSLIVVEEGKYRIRM